MNFYNKHIGDHAVMAGHLSLMESGVFGRAELYYLANERPLPPELDKVRRLLGARSPEEFAALDAVLADFFVLQDDGWHHAQWDLMIAAFQEGEPERAARKANEETRSDRHRLERRRLFEVLNRAGQHAAWNTGIKELRDLVLLHCGPEALKTAEFGPKNEPLATANSSQDVYMLTNEVTALATAPATPATETPTPVTANQYPIPSTQYPIPKGINSCGKPPGSSPGSGDLLGDQHSQPVTSTKPGRQAAKPLPVTAEVWEAYSAAFTARYGTGPVRNQKVNGMLAQLVTRLGAEEAPKVAEFYVGNEEPFYVRATHTVDLLLRDAEKLRMQWATGRSNTAGRRLHSGFDKLDYLKGVNADGSLV